jgi:hypothetical protein
MTATYCVAGRWYYIEDATIVSNEFGRVPKPELWSGWIHVSEKKYHTESTVTLIGHMLNKDTHPQIPLPPDDIDFRRVVLEMRRGLTVKTLKDGPPVYVINEQTLI